MAFARDVLFRKGELRRADGAGSMDDGVTDQGICMKAGEGQSL